MVAALVRRSFATQLAASVSSSSSSAWASGSRALSSSVRIHYSDNGSAPARAHRPRSMVGPDAPGQLSSRLGSKQEEMGTAPTPEQQDVSNKAAVNLSSSMTPSEGSGSTRKRVGDSAMSILDNLASTTSTLDGTASIESPVTTPSSPGLIPVYQTPSGPIYTPSKLPFKTDPTLDFLVNLLMKDGKKAQAERLIRLSLEYISQLTHSNPLPLVKRAIERCSPMVRMQTRKSGAKNVQVPLALTNRQSMRKGIVWILEAANKRYDREFSRRLAAEFIAVSEGNSPALQRKEQEHKIATTNRANAAIRV